ncbi:hypothetical protein GE21DRAFT_1218828, partial [Neurospora crassa]
ANKILLSTFKNTNITTTLNINGWDRTGRNPKVTYNLIQLYIARITNEACSKVFAEYLTIKRTNFNTIVSFLIRYTLLRKRIKDAKFIIDNNFEVTFLYNTIKIVYPINTKY